MMKFFRRYNKHLLAVFMVLLMVVFLGGSALESMFAGNPNVTVAHTALGEIGTVDQQRAMATTGLLAAMNLDWRRPVPGVGKPMEIVDWIILTREARQLEGETSPEAVRAWFGGDTAVERVAEVARARRVKPNMIWNAIREYRSVAMTTRSIAGTSGPSTAEIRAAARNILDKVRVNAAILPARSFVDEMATFDEVEIEAQWTRYRDSEPGTGLNFGYYVPAAITAQFIRIDREKLAAEVRIPNIEKRAKRYFDKNRSTDAAFRRPRRDPSAEGPVPANEASPYLTWKEATDVAIEKVRGQAADETADRIVAFLVVQAGELWLEVDRSPEGYKIAPKGAAEPSYYNGLLGTIPATISYPDAVSIGVTESFSQAEALDVAMIGGASYRPSRGLPLSFATLSFRNQAIVPNVRAMTGASSADYLSLQQTSPYPLTDAEGNVYAFRVISAVGAHVPESVDEVRDRVVEDLRLLQGYNRALARAEGLRSCSPVKSLQEAFDSDEDLTALQDTEYGEGLAFDQSPLVPRLRFYELGAPKRSSTTYIGPEIGQVPSAFVDKWFQLEGEEPAIMELKDRATVMVVEWSETQGGREDEFSELRERLVNAITNRRSRAAAADWLDPDNIRARNGFSMDERQ